MSVYLFVLLVGVLHSLLPNHWLSTPALVRTISLPVGRAIPFFVMTALTHNLSTFFFAILVGGFSILAHESLEYFNVVAFAFLLLVGLSYIFSKEKGHCHHPEEMERVKELNKKGFIRSFLAVLASMFFSPCIDVVFAIIPAGNRFGFGQVFNLSVMYVVVSVSAMSLLMTLSYSRMLKIHFHFFEKNFKRIIGVFFIILAFSNYWTDKWLDEVIDMLSEIKF